MEMIIKPLGAGQDPLNQRQTKQLSFNRLHGLYKPTLIDLESLIKADRAQAEAEMLLAA